MACARPAHREGRRRQGGRAPAAVALTIVIRSLPLLSYVLTDCSYLLYIHATCLLRAHSTESPRVPGRVRLHHGTYREHRKDAECSICDSKDGNDTSRISSSSPSIPPIESPLCCGLIDTYKSAGTRTWFGEPGSRYSIERTTRNWRALSNNNRRQFEDSTRTSMGEQGRWVYAVTSANLWYLIVPS